MPFLPLEDDVVYRLAVVRPTVGALEDEAPDADLPAIPRLTGVPVHEVLDVGQTVQVAGEAAFVPDEIGVEVAHRPGDVVERRGAGPAVGRDARVGAAGHRVAGEVRRSRAAVADTWDRGT